MLFKEIHEIVYHGNGGYSTETIYNIPIWWRRFIFNNIKDYHEKQQEAREKQQNVLKNKGKTSNKVELPPVQPPTYSSKLNKGAQK